MRFWRQLPRYGTFEIGYGTLIELSSDFLKLIRDFEVCDTRLPPPRYGTLPSAIPDFAVRDLRHAARACRRIPPMPSQPPHQSRLSNCLHFTANYSKSPQRERILSAEWRARQETPRPATSGCSHSDPEEDERNHEHIELTSLRTIHLF